MNFISVILEPLVIGKAVTDYLAESVKPTLLEGLAQLCEVKPVDPVVWLADWLLMNNPNKPKTDEITAVTPT
jgi:nucleoside-diphosphate kinase